MGPEVALSHIALQYLILGEYSPMVRGYLLIFMLDDGRTMCRSVMFPECKKPLVGILINLYE